MYIVHCVFAAVAAGAYVLWTHAWAEEAYPIVVVYVLAKSFVGVALYCSFGLVVGQSKWLNVAFHESVATEFVHWEFLRSSHPTLAIMLLASSVMHGVCISMVRWNWVTGITGILSVLVITGIFVAQRVCISIAQLVHHAVVLVLPIVLYAHDPSRLGVWMLVLTTFEIVDLWITTFFNTHRIANPTYDIASRGVIVSFPLPTKLRNTAVASGCFVNLFVPWVSRWQTRPISLLLNHERTRGMLVVESKGWFTRTFIMMVMDRLVRSGFWIQGPFYTLDTWSASRPQNQFVVATGFAITGCLHLLESPATTLIWIVPHVSLVKAFIPFLVQKHGHCDIYCTDPSPGCFDELVINLQNAWEVELGTSNSVTVMAHGNHDSGVKTYTISMHRPDIVEVLKRVLIERERARRRSREQVERTLSDSFVLQMIQAQPTGTRGQWQLRYYGQVEAIQSLMHTYAMTHHLAFYHEKK